MPLNLRFSGPVLDKLHNGINGVYHSIGLQSTADHDCEISDGESYSGAELTS